MNQSFNIFISILAALLIVFLFWTNIQPKCVVVNNFPPD